MRKASVSILKARLSQYLAAVKSGEEILVTERGRPVARLTGLGTEGPTEGRVAKLVREGRLRPPTASDTAGRTEDAPPRDARGHSLRALLDERSESR